MKKLRIKLIADLCLSFSISRMEELAVAPTSLGAYLRHRVSMGEDIFLP
jgi:hypothetical protein